MKLFTTPIKELSVFPACPPATHISDTPLCVPKPPILLLISHTVPVLPHVLSSALTKAKLEEDIKARPIIKVAIFLIIFL